MTIDTGNAVIKAGDSMVGCKGSSSNSFLVCTYKDKIFEISESMLDLTSYKAEEIIGIDINSYFKLLNTNIEKDSLVEHESYIIFSRCRVPLECKIKIEANLETRIYFFYDMVNALKAPELSAIYQLCANSLSTMAIYTADDLRIIHSNKLKFRNVEVNYNAEELVGKRLDEVFPFIKETNLEFLMKRVIDDGRPYNDEEFMIVLPGSILSCWNIAFTPIYVKDKIKYLVVTAEDVSEKIKSRNIIVNQENLISTQKNQLEAIIENMSDCLFISDSTGRYIKLNKTARETFDQSGKIQNIGDVIKLNPMYDEKGDLLQVDGLPVVRALNGEDMKNVRVSLYKDDGIKYYDINATPIFNGKGKVSNVVMCFRDVTYLMREQEIIIKQKNYFYDIINSLDFPIVRLSFPELNVIELNNRAKNLISLGDYKEYPLTIYDILSIMDVDDNDIYLNSLRNIKDTKYLKNIKIKSISNQKHYNVVCQPLLNIEEEIKELVIIVVDVTDEILQKEKINNLLKAQEEFFSFISHEFKTPITVALSALQVLEFAGKETINSVTRKYINKIRQSCLQQLRLVNNLLDITRADSGYLKVNRKNVNIVEITRMIVESIELYSREKEISICFNSQSEDIYTALDDEKYERVILNLLSNAVKFTPKGKKIYVEIYKEKDEIIIMVKDEGIGIPKEKLEYIFERYSQLNNGLTRNSEGTGIGLCLAKLMAKALGGDIKVESEIDIGTTFKVFIPIQTIEENSLQRDMDLLDNRLMRSINIEFSHLETS